MHFVAICRDRPDGLQTRLAHRPRHLEWLDAGDGTIRLAGPILDADGETPRGSIFILEAEDAGAARAFLATDPYNDGDLFASVELLPWRRTVGAEV